MINGKRYSWEDITITLPTGVIVGIKDIDYGDKKEFEALYGKGSDPVAYGAGNYSAQGKMKVTREEFDKLNYYAVASRGFYNIRPFPVTVAYSNEDRPVSTDVLKSCKFTERSWKGAEGDKELNVELTFLILDGIYPNGVAPNVAQGLP